jgi:NAD kinase
MAGKEPKIILVKRSTRLEELVARFNTVLQAKFYIEHLGADFSDYQLEDEVYKRAVSDAAEILSAYGRVQVVDRNFVPNFIFGSDDLVVTIGQDGLVANTMKYLTGHMLIGVNPDPVRWDGVLLPFTVKDLRLIVPEVLRHSRLFKEVTMARAQLNDGQSIYAVNDFFIGQRTHVSARYLIQLGAKQEQQSSSGIIVSTGLGSSAWLKSVITGAAAIVKSLNRNGDLEITHDCKIDWGSDYLYYSVREPFPSQVSQANLVFGKVTEKQPLIIRSQMADNGVIFSDGIESDFLQFNSGIEVTITVAEKKGHLVM